MFVFVISRIILNTCHHDLGSKSRSQSKVIENLVYTLEATFFDFMVLVICHTVCLVDFKILFEYGSAGSENTKKLLHTLEATILT